MKRIRNILLVITFLMCLCYGNLSFTSTKEALMIWFEKLVPSMFVSLVLIRCLYHLQIFKHLHIPLIPHLFHVDPSAVSIILCSMFLGFPNGALLIDEAKRDERITMSSAQRLLYTCCFPAPGFVIMSCGSVFFHSTKVGILLFVSQLLSGMILLLCTRHIPITCTPLKQAEPMRLMNALSSSILESGKALYMIGGYLMLFMCACSVLVSFLPDILAFPIRIIAEFSSGCALIQTLPFDVQALQYLTCLLIGFGGFCVHMQICSMSEHITFSYPVFLGFRIIQSLLSLLIFSLFI